MSMQTHEYLFYCLGHILTLPYFIAQIAPILAIGTPFSQFLCPLIYVHHYEVLVVCFLSAFLHQEIQDALSSFCLFPTPIPESVISPSPFHGLMELQSKIWSLGVLVTTIVSFLLGFLSCQSEEMCPC